jgi:DNA gyrase subunit A
MPEYIEGHKIPVTIEDEMKKSYMDYAMSVIIGRALPDVRDGLKPVHRRILFAMQESGTTFNRAHKKSARVVGDVMGRYHPHGDGPIYDAVVRLVQDFSLRYPMIDGQGNFGSIDGDRAAAMRYTEVKMQRVAGEMLRDIDKQTVDFQPNYDGSLSEPLVLPAVFPNLLCNGSSGIAVGMATNFPPHNLTEVINGIIALIKNENITIDELMEYVTGPDFPTGGYIYGKEGIVQAYKTGRGSIRIRARATIERAQKGDKTSIIVNELPYQVNKSRLLEKIADLVRNKKIESISDLRDESDRDGMRVVISLKRGEVPEVVLNQLFKHTQLQVSWGINMLAIDGRRPRLYNLKTAMEAYVGHRREILIRRTLFDLEKAEARLHILEGLIIAVDNIDEVIRIIRAAADVDIARANLMESFSISEIQSQAILDMRLQRLTGLERQKLVDEYEEVKALIAELNHLLASDEKQKQVIITELEELLERYGDGRRSEIIDEVSEFQVEDLIKEEPMVITITKDNYIKRTAMTTYRKQRRGGKGRIGMATKDEDFVKRLFIASTHDYILIFTKNGQLYWLKVHELPEIGAAGRGKSIVNMVQIEKDDAIAAIINVRDFDPEKFVVLVSKKGLIKRTSLDAYKNPRANGIIAMGLNEDDVLLDAQLSDDSSFIVLSTRNGYAIRFKEKDVRSMGRTARGVIGINMRDGDELVGMQIVTDLGTLLTVTTKGYGKRTPIEDYRVTGRGGMGVVNIKVSAKNGNVVGVAIVEDDDEVILISKKGKILRTRVSGISTIGRATQGVRVLDLETGDSVVAMAKVVEKEETEEEEAEA